jgi:hypothetical protein
LVSQIKNEASERKKQKKKKRWKTEEEREDEKGKKRRARDGDREILPRVRVFYFIAIFPLISGVMTGAVNTTVHVTETGVAFVCRPDSCPFSQWLRLDPAYPCQPACENASVEVSPSCCRLVVPYCERQAGEDPACASIDPNTVCNIKCKCSISLHHHQSINQSIIQSFNQSIIHSFILFSFIFLSFFFCWNVHV